MLLSKKRKSPEDPPVRIRQALTAFCEQNQNMPKSLRISVTGAIVHTNTLEIRDFYLAADKTRPLLSPLEKAGFKSFTASQQWCSKVMIAGGWNSRMLHGKVRSVDKAAAEPLMERIRATIQEYGLKFTYNMDETGYSSSFFPIGPT